jgi:hypothetical protein
MVKKIVVIISNCIDCARQHNCNLLPCGLDMAELNVPFVLANKIPPDCPLEDADEEDAE